MVSSPDGLRSWNNCLPKGDFFGIEIERQRQGVYRLALEFWGSILAPGQFGAFFGYPGLQGLFSPALK